MAVNDAGGDAGDDTGDDAGRLRVVDLTGDLGRYATKLLVELGCDVVRISSTGDRGHPMSDHAADRFGGVLDWWYDAGKRSLPLDLDDPGDRDTYRGLVGRADLVVETTAPGWLARRGIDHDSLVGDHPELVQVSLTPFGRTGPRAGWQAGDLVLGALGGVLSVTGTADRPLTTWGRQCHNLAGLHAALFGLVAALAARRTGHGAHVDVSAQQVVASCLEHVLMQYTFDDVLETPAVAVRQGSRHWRGALEIAPCRDGYAVISAAPLADDLLAWLADDGFPEAADFIGERTRERIGEVMSLVRAFAGTQDVDHFWRESQRRGTAAAEVLDLPRAAQVPQLAHRRLFTEIEVPGGSTVTLPGRLLHRPAHPPPPPTPPGYERATPGDLFTAWPVRRGTGCEHSGDGRGQVDTAASRSSSGLSPGGPPRPLDGIRVADFSWVMAGPHATRLLGDLGADVIRVQTAARSATINDPAEPFFAVWNRSKRSASLDMSHPRALEFARRLVEHSDVLIENFSAGVLARWGLDWDTLQRWNPRLIYITMSGCGHDGPWRDLIAFAPTIHAWCGLSYLTNPADVRDVGPGVSTSDHAAGIAAALAAAAALLDRERTGRGQLIDLAQLDVGIHLMGAAFVDLLSNGRAAEPAGNVDGLHAHVPDEVYATVDGHLAISCLDDDQFARLVDVVDDDRLRDAAFSSEAGRRLSRDRVDEVVADWARVRSGEAASVALQSAGVPAGVVHDAIGLTERDPQLRARAAWQVLRHDLHGDRIVDRVPTWWDGAPLDVPRSAPAYVGADNFDVWAELGGLTSAEVAEGMADGPFR